MLNYCIFVSGLFEQTFLLANLGYTGNRDSYPTGLIHPPVAEYNQPLIQPPAYHDVVYKK